MRTDEITSLGATFLAFLATQHHTLHMLLFAIGIGGACRQLTRHAVPEPAGI